MTNTFKVDDRVGFLKSSFESRHIRGTILGANFKMTVGSFFLMNQTETVTKRMSFIIVA